MTHLEKKIKKKVLKSKQINNNISNKIHKFNAFTIFMYLLFKYIIKFKISVRRGKKKKKKKKFLVGVKS